LQKPEPRRQEDGVPQAIRYFSRESGLPLTIGLLVDTSISQFHVLEPERRASFTSLHQVLREGQDEAFVAHFDLQVEALQGFTPSRKDLAASLGQLAVPKRWGTLLYDAIRLCSENLMRKQKGRNAFILLSDGVDFRSKTSLETAIEWQRADTIVYSVLFATPFRPTGQSRPRSSLRAGISPDVRQRPDRLDACDLPFIYRPIMPFSRPTAKSKRGLATDKHG
jgi:VWFA-related protein